MALYKVLDITGQKIDCGSDKEIMHRNLYHLKSNKMYPRERVFDISLFPLGKECGMKMA